MKTFARRSALRLNCVGVVTAGILLGGQAAAQTQSNEAEVAEIVVTGSALRSSVPAELQATPVTIIGSDRIVQSGSQSVDDLLRDEPALFGNRRADGRSGEDGARLNLRGLGEQYTLTLFNGRRISSDGPGNINLIPLDAIDRTEILKSGASAIYGSDAVAGVVNFVSRKAADGVSLHATYGDARNGADTLLVGGSAGVAGERTRMFIAADYTRRTPLLSYDRKITNTSDFRARGGADFRFDYNSPAPICGVPGADGCLILDTSKVGRGQFSNNPADYREFDFERDALDIYADRDVGITIINGTKRINVFGSLEHDLNDEGTLSVFAEGLFLDERQRNRFGVEIPNFGGEPCCDGYRGVIAVPATNPYNPFGVEVSDVRFATVGSDSVVNSVNQTGRFIAGVRGDAAPSLKFEVAAGLFRTRIDQIRPNSISVDGLNRAVSRTGADAFNPFCNRCNTAAQYAGVLEEQNNSDEQTMKTVDASLGGKLLTLPAGDVQFNVGAQYRREVSVSEANAGYQRSYGVPARQRQGRHVQALFAEVRAPLIEGSGNNARLELSGAVRYEHFSDVGDTVDPLAAVRFEAVPDTLTLRAAYSTAFRAPYLAQFGATNVGGVFIAVVDPTPPPGGDSTAQVESLQTGNPNLKPEKSRSFSAGAVFTPRALGDLFVSLDYYNVRQTGVIATPTAQAVVNGAAPGVVTRDATGTIISVQSSVFNLASRRIEGLDFTARYNVRVGRAKITPAVNMNYLLSFKADNADDLGSVDYLGQFSYLFGSVPRFRLSASLTAELKPATFSATLDYTSSYRDERTFVELEPDLPRIPSYVTVDLYGGLDLGGVIGGKEGDYMLGVGVDNAFDRQPPFIVALNGYDSSEADVRGRYVYASIRAKF